MLNLFAIGALVSIYLVGKGTENGEQVDNKAKSEDNTYEYWKDLSYEEQFTYFSTNEYLKDYMQNDYYSTDRELTARHVQDIANKLNRQFTNKYNRY